MAVIIIPSRLGGQVQRKESFLWFYDLFQVYLQMVCISTPSNIKLEYSLRKYDHVYRWDKVRGNGNWLRQLNSVDNTHVTQLQCDISSFSYGRRLQHHKRSHLTTSTDFLAREYGRYNHMAAIENTSRACWNSAEVWGFSFAIISLLSLDTTIRLRMF